MVSEAMLVQDQSGGNGSDTALPSLDMGTPSMEGVQLKGQFLPVDDFSPKVRKPYTITKQRERWTEDEHKKFLEALKLYGRAWRKIEEHVGTKTAVQIRSHAQKFFSKVVRESIGGVTSTVKPIEIPPPRPKRKPMHPYPRKMVLPVKTGISPSEEPTRSTPSNLSLPEQEDLSPKSVLSAISSEALGRTDSSTPDGSRSPVSSAVAANDGAIIYSEAASLMLEETRSSSPGQKDSRSSPDVEAPLNLELSSQNKATTKEDMNKSSMRYLKLFGKTLLVTDPHGPSHQTPGIFKSQSLDRNDGTCLETLPWNFMAVNFSPSESECAWNALSHGAPMSLCGNQIKNDKSNSMDDCLVPLPWLTLYEGATLQPLQVHSPITIKARPSCDKKEKVDDDDQKDGSSTGSNTDLVGASVNDDKSWEVEAQSYRLSVEREGEEKTPSFSKLSDKARAKSVNCKKGFVPYKRCLAERESAVSSTVTGEEREEQRIRLCL